MVIRMVSTWTYSVNTCAYSVPCIGAFFLKLTPVQYTSRVMIFITHENEVSINESILTFNSGLPLHSLALYNNKYHMMIIMCVHSFSEQCAPQKSWPYLQIKLACIAISLCNYTNIRAYLLNLSIRIELCTQFINTYYIHMYIHFHMRM